MVDYIVAFNIYSFTCKKGMGLFICLSSLKYDTEEHLSHIFYDFKITLAFFQLCEGSPCSESSLIYDDITSSWRQHYYVTDPAAVRSKVHVKQLWACKTRLQFSGKQAGPRVRVKESGPSGRRRRKIRKQILKYGRWHEQKLYPQHFHTMLGEMKKKLMKGKQAGEALELCSLAWLRKALENRGVT